MRYKKCSNPFQNDMQDMQYVSGKHIYRPKRQGNIVKPVRVCPFISTVFLPFEDGQATKLANVRRAAEEPSSNILKHESYFCNSVISIVGFKVKGQIISKANYGILNSSKNERTNSFLLLCDLFLFVFWKKLKTSKIHFKII